MDKHYELLTRLYLRLKGYIVSNLILHSEQEGMSKSELDIIAMRLPYHSQEYRWVEVTDYLESSESIIEILIADVKNTKNLEKVKFNEGLRKDRGSIKQLIDWIGIYESVGDEEINKFESVLNLHRNNKLSGFAELDEDLLLGKFKIKFTFFCPSLPVWNGKGFKYIHGKEIIDFIWECLNESRKVKTCSRRYDFGGWNELEDYVRFFKGKNEKITKEEFEEYCKHQLAI